MSASSGGKPDFAAAKEDIAALKRDVAKLIENLKFGAASRARGTAEQMDEAAQRLYRTAAGEADRSVKAMGQKVEEQPMASLLIALGVGYIAGRLLSR